MSLIGRLVSDEAIWICSLEGWLAGSLRYYRIGFLHWYVP